MEMTVFEKLWVLRRRLGLTQTEIAKLIGCSRRTVQEWEKGNGQIWVCGLAVFFLEDLVKQQQQQ